MENGCVAASDRENLDRMEHDDEGRSASSDTFRIYDKLNPRKVDVNCIYAGFKNHFTNNSNNKRLRLYLIVRRFAFSRFSHRFSLRGESVSERSEHNASIQFGFSKFKFYLRICHTIT